MKRAATIILGFMFVLAVGALLWPNLGSQARADRGCVPGYRSSNPADVHAAGGD